MKVRKKPVVVDAMIFIEEMVMEVAEWCGGEVFGDGHDSPYIKIHTLEGDMLAMVGDWIIRGVSGEFYPVKPKIFDQTYEIC